MKNIIKKIDPVSKQEKIFPVNYDGIDAYVIDLGDYVNPKSFICKLNGIVIKPIAGQNPDGIQYFLKI